MCVLEKDTVCIDRGGTFLYIFYRQFHWTHVSASDPKLCVDHLYFIEFKFIFYCIIIVLNKQYIESYYINN